jgi:hypothetical protein
MAVEERRRAELFERLEQSIGPQATDTLFAMLPPAGHTVATTADLDRFGGDLRAEMAALSAELRGEMSELRAELRGEMATLSSDLRGEMAGMRGELLAAFRHELGAAFAHQNRTMLLGLVGTLLSAVGLAAVLARFVA